MRDLRREGRRPQPVQVFADAMLKQSRTGLSMTRLRHALIVRSCSCTISRWFADHGRGDRMEIAAAWHTPSWADLAVDVLPLAKKRPDVAIAVALNNRASGEDSCDELNTDLSVSINLSRGQFEQSNLLQTIRERWKRAGFRAEPAVN